MSVEQTSILILSATAAFLAVLLSSGLTLAVVALRGVSRRLWDMVLESRQSEREAWEEMRRLVLMEVPPSPLPSPRHSDGSPVGGDPKGTTSESLEIPTEESFARAAGLNGGKPPILSEFITGNPRIPGFSPRVDGP